MRTALCIGVALVIVSSAACVPPGRQPQTRSERLEFEQDHDRCIVQTEILPGVVEPVDYRSCMRVRGWSEAPD
jgi:hypothetical protein